MKPSEEKGCSNLFTTDKIHKIIPPYIEDEWYKYIIHNTTEGFFITDTKGSILDVNDAYCKMSGYSRQELLSMNLCDIGFPGDRNLTRQQKLKGTRKALLNPRNYEGFWETKHIRKDGQVIDISVSAKFLDIMGGIIFHFNRDVTEQKKNEKQLRFSSAAFKAIKEAIVITDLESNILSWNEGSEKIYGIKSDEAIGKKLFDVIKLLKPSRTHIQAHQEKTLANGYSHKEHFMIAKNKELWVDVSAYLITKESGEKQAILYIITDITERKRLEAEIEKYQENLEKLVKERTIGLVKINNNLKKEIAERIQAQQKIEEQDAQKADFLRMLVHELKTPLTPLISMSEYLLTNYNNDESLDKHLQSIKHGINKLNKRIDELMDLSRGEMGLLKIEHNNINFVSLLADISKYMELDIQKKHQSFISNIPESLPVIRGDEERIWQVLNNLLNNASKFTPKGGVIELCATDNKNEIVVSIKNTGTSLTDEQRQDIFQPYHSFHTQRDGLGLGLILSRMLVELHGGRIWAEDDNGKGNIFSFAIPVDLNLNK